MAERSLVQYIRKYKDQYNVEQLRSYLIRQGYNPNDVEQAIILSGKKQIKISLKHIFVALLGLIVATFILLAYLMSSDTKEISLFLTLQPKTPSIKQGEPIQFNIFLRSSTEKQVNVDLMHEIYQKNVLSAKKQEKVSFKKLQHFPGIIYANLNPGKYMLKSTLIYQEKIIEQQFEFIVEEAVEQPKIITKEELEICYPTCNDYNVCTNDICRENVCVYTEIVPCCGNNICEENEILSCSSDCKKTEIKVPVQTVDLAKTDPEKAAKLCYTVPARETGCLYDLAEKTGNSIFCTAINERSSKDACYIDYSTRTKDYTICERITDEFLQRSCFMQKQLHEKITEQ